MYVCLGCNHPLFYHRPNGKAEPCFLCPPDECQVEGCSCPKYDGQRLSSQAHSEHHRYQIRWGTWGLVNFSLAEDQTFVAGPEPVIERAHYRGR